MKSPYLYITLIISLFSVLSTYAQDGAGAIRYRLSYRDDPATTIVIGWDQVSGVDATVYYGTTDEGTVSESYTDSHVVDRIEDSHGMKSRFARLAGLTPNTVYYFVLDNGAAGDRYWFKTQPDSPEAMSIIAGGDTRSNHDVRRNGFDIVRKLSPNLVYFGGDYTNSADDASWKKWLNDWQLTTREDGKMIPIIGATGNHENRGDIEEIFDGANPDGGNNNEYYSLAFGGDMWKAYVLNTEITPGGNQGTWLEEDLIASQDFTYRTAIYHTPMRPHTKWKSEENTQYNAWAQYFYDYKVALVVESDAHTGKTTEKIAPCSGGPACDEDFMIDGNGTVYVGEGCWGAPLYKDEDSKSWTKCYSEFDQIRWVFITPTEIEIKVIRIGMSGSSESVDDADRFATPDGLYIWDCDESSTVIIDAQGASEFELFEYSTDEVCYGACDGMASVLITGGTAPYDYSWSNGEGGDDVEAGSVSVSVGLCEGTYTITVTDDGGNGVSQTATFTIGSPTMIAITETIAGTSDCETACDGSIDLTIAGNVGAQTSTFSATSSDYGGRTALKDGDCESDVYYIDFIPELSYAKVDNNSIISICVSFTHPSPADLTVQVVGITAGGGYKELNLIAPGDLPAGENIDMACFTRDATESISTGTAPYTGEWKPIDNFTDNIFALSNVITTDYWYLSAWDCDGNGVTGSIDYFEIVFLEAADVTSYTWSNGSSTEDISGLCNGTYTVTVSDNYGCTQSRAIGIDCFSSINDREVVRDLVYQDLPGRLRIQTSKAVTGVEVYSMDGKRVFNGGARTRSIDLSRTKTGVYLVKVRTGKSSFAQKIVVTN
ncbi:MAG: T9SS type A sorting domain-containing protein [Flavobacteriales bacterium]|nr:T9SS type A sorting domain-containing protein [Flavobacteriales bacterium]